MNQPDTPFDDDIEPAELAPAAKPARREAKYPRVKGDQHRCALCKFHTFYIFIRCPICEVGTAIKLVPKPEAS